MSAFGQAALILSGTAEPRHMSSLPDRWCNGRNQVMFLRQKSCRCGTCRLSKVGAECPKAIDALQMTISPGNSVGDSFANEAHGATAAPEQRDRFIPLRKSDIVGGLVAEGGLDAAEQASLSQFARTLGAIFHHRYFEELDRLREAYFYFDPELDPKACDSAN